ncbi:MAG: hypothetical protein AAGN46_00940 [Acidobacteriota bacterium]
MSDMQRLAASELARFRRALWGFGLAHFLMLQAAASLTDLLAPSAVRDIFALLVYGVGGLMLGLVQVGGHRSPNRWAYLIHRPMTHWRIAASLATAGAAFLTLTVALPQLAVLVSLDLASPQWVDARHYVLVPYVLAISLAFYGLGIFVSIAPSRAALLTLGLPLLMLSREASGARATVWLLILLVWIGTLALVSFRPDRRRPLSDPGALAAVGLALQVVLVPLLTVATMVAYQLGIVLIERGPSGFATHAWDDHFEAGTYPHLEYRDGAEALEHGLRLLSSEASDRLAAQIALTETQTLEPRLSRPARRHQLPTTDRAGVWTDSTRDVTWTFAHDVMAYRGVDRRTGRAVGWLGAEGRPAESRADVVPFLEVPEALPAPQGDWWLVTPGRLAQFRVDLERIDERLLLRDSERFLTGLEPAGGSLAALTDRALLLVDPRALERAHGRVEPIARVPIEGDWRDLTRVDVAQLIDGMVLSMMWGQRSERGVGSAHQRLVELRLEGTVTELGTVPLEPGWPSLYRYRAFALSPALAVVGDLMRWAIAPAASGRIAPRELLGRSLPAGVVLVAGCLSLLSAAVVAWAGARRGLPRAWRRAWVVWTALAGIPSLIVFFALTPATARPGRLLSPPRVVRNATQAPA